MMDITVVQNKDTPRPRVRIGKGDLDAALDIQIRRVNEYTYHKFPKELKKSL
jgi:hypothetical protein